MRHEYFCAVYFQYIFIRNYSFAKLAGFCSMGHKYLFKCTQLLHIIIENYELRKFQKSCQILFASMWVCVCVSVSVCLCVCNMWPEFQNGSIHMHPNYMSLEGHNLASKKHTFCIYFEATYICMLVHDTDSSLCKYLLQIWSYESSKVKNIVKPPFSNPVIYNCI